MSDLVLLNLWCFERVHFQFDIDTYWSSVHRCQSYVLRKTNVLALWGVCNIIVDCYGLCNVYLQTTLALASFIALVLIRLNKKNPVT